jgi:hypothetical protein
MQEFELRATFPDRTSPYCTCRRHCWNIYFIKKACHQSLLMILDFDFFLWGRGRGIPWRPHYRESITSLLEPPQWWRTARYVSPLGPHHVGFCTCLQEPPQWWLIPGDVPPSLGTSSCLLLYLPSGAFTVVTYCGGCLSLGTWRFLYLPPGASTVVTCCEGGGLP